MIQIIPAIDIISGRCVRLTQGDYSQLTAYDGSPLDMARRFEEAGLTRLHLVDLEGAKHGTPRNLQVLEDIASKTSLLTEWGGGIKTDADLNSVFSAGGGAAIVGSVAVRNPELFEHWLVSFGADRIILGADVRNGRVAVAGWLEDTPLTIAALLSRFVPKGLTQAIVTDIAKDGMLQGPSADLYARLESEWPRVIFTVSGGVSAMADIRMLDSLGLKRVIVGKALYENKITLRQIAAFINSDSDPDTTSSHQTPCRPKE